MPRRKSKLFTAVVEGPLPKILRDKVEWRLIEVAYGGKKWSRTIRDQICDRTNYYIMFAAAEAAHEPLSVSSRHLEKIQKTASELHGLLTGKRGRRLSYSERHTNMWLALILNGMDDSRGTKLDIDDQINLHRLSIHAQR